MGKNISREVTRCQGPGGGLDPAGRRGGDAGSLVNDEDDRDIGWIVERAIPLAHFDGLEPIAVLQPLLDALDRIRPYGIPYGDPRQLDHIGVGDRGIAVHPDLVNRFNRLRLVGDERPRSRDLPARAGSYEFERESRI